MVDGGFLIDSKRIRIDGLNKCKGKEININRKCFYGVNEMNLNKIPHQIMVHGDVTYRGDCPLEVAEQVSFLCMLRKEFPKLAEIAVHIRNEGKRTKRQGAQHKKEGMNTVC